MYLDLETGQDVSIDMDTDLEESQDVWTGHKESIYNYMETGKYVSPWMGRLDRKLPYTWKRASQ